MTATVCVLDPIRDLAGIYPVRPKSSHYRLRPTQPACVTELVHSTELSPFERVVVKQFLLCGKNIAEIAQSVSNSGLAPEINPSAIETTLGRAFRKMNSVDQQV